MNKLTPMMAKYLETKEEYKDCILFYRLGDFYEMFFEDALTASKVLEITLTGKDCGLEERAPMCGVPFHAAENYLNKLVKNGYKVAICEQVEDPKQAKGLVKREVVRVVTPGTNISSLALDETKNNYIMCIVYIGDIFGIATADITTGDYYVTQVDTLRLMNDEINKFVPSEIICNQAFNVSGVDIDEIKNRLGISMYSIESWYFDDELCKKTLLDHFSLLDLSGLGLNEFETGIIASGALLKYLYETQKNSLSQLTKITPYKTGNYMLIDTSTRRNLELLETLREKQKRGSLLGVLDKTKTAMGARLLRKYIEQPLIIKEEILKRQNAIDKLKKEMITREELREYLSSIYDLERLIGRIICKSANPRDLIAFKNSIKMLGFVKYLIKDINSEMIKDICENIDPLLDIIEKIEAAIDDEPPIAIKDGGIIKSTFNDEINRLRSAKTEGKNWIAQLEASEKESTKIKSLKIKYNKVFGYYLEVSNTYKDLVPDYYIRKQTTVNAERYITPKLKELEDTIIGAQDRLYSLEYEIFSEIRDEIAKEVLRIQKSAKAIANIDVLASLAFVAEKNNYKKPNINERGIIDIKSGRHPVVELMMKNDMFIDNDTYLDMNNNRIAIITGPNMAGKSTYMRQVALITLMAQIGSFVPATSADISICDRIFTRVGASDDLATGQSTFMVEMSEVANILRNATNKSLLILDEIGRGTSTFDGLSIAWAVTEYISNTKVLGAKTLFATHYHELTELEGTLQGVSNYCIAVKEKGEDIVFLRKIIKGGADKSYGIQVAKLAGVPESVIQRARELAIELSDADIIKNAREITNKSKSLVKDLCNCDNVELSQMTLFDTAKNDDIIDEIMNMDIANLTPIEAMNSLFKLQNKAKNRWKNV